jgi:hypothetical protein
MPEWSEARHEGDKARNRELAGHDKEQYQPHHPASSGICFLCGGHRKLLSGSIAGIPVLHCEKHRDAYREIKAIWEAPDD